MAHNRIFEWHILIFIAYSGRSTDRIPPHDRLGSVRDQRGVYTTRYHVFRQDWTSTYTDFRVLLHDAALVHFG